MRPDAACLGHGVTVPHAFKAAARAAVPGRAVLTAVTHGSSSNASRCVGTTPGKCNDVEGGSRHMAETRRQWYNVCWWGVVPNDRAA